MLEIPSLRSSRSTKIVQQNSQGESRWDAVCKDSRGGARGLKAKKRAEVRRWLGKESRGGAKRFSAPKKPEVGRRAGKDSRGGAMSVFFQKEVESLNCRTEAATWELARGFRGNGVTARSTNPDKPRMLSG